MSKNVLTIIITIGIFLCLFCNLTDAITSSPSSLPCPAGDLIRVIRRSFRKVVPEYNPNTISVEVKSDAKLRTQPTDPNLFNFLLSFQDTADGIIARDERIQILKISMQTLLAYDFSKFLFSYGRPLSCISYYIGATDDYSQVLAVYKRAFSSYKYFSKRLVLNIEDSFAPVRGKDILQRLGVFIKRKVVLKEKPTDKVCSQFIIEAKDGRILAKYPTVNLLPRYIRIPGEKAILETYKQNVTHSLQKYYDNALSCLDSDVLRAQYSSSLASWISDKLVPALLDARVCSRGFPRLLHFLATVDSYRESKTKYLHIIPLENPVITASIEISQSRPTEQQKMVLQNSKDNNYDLDQDYEPVQALGHSADETSTNGSTYGDAVAASASATIFLIFFACFLPLIFLIYHLYMKDHRTVKLRNWLAEKLTDTEDRGPQRPRQRNARMLKRPSPPKEKAPLMVPSSSDNEMPPSKKNFRSNSRDIYIQMAEYPMDISIEERDEVSSTEESSPDLSDELNITRNISSKQKFKVPSNAPFIKHSPKTKHKQNRRKPRNGIFSDGGESEELFSRQKKQGSIYDFTSSKPQAKQHRRDYKPNYMNNGREKKARSRGDDTPPGLTRNSKGELVLPMNRPFNSFDKGQNGGKMKSNRK